MNKRVMKIKIESRRHVTVRQCISVPVKIKKLMIAYQRENPDVNWSKVAARAFKRLVLNGKENNGKKETARSKKAG